MIFRHSRCWVMALGRRDILSWLNRNTSGRRKELEPVNIFHHYTSHLFSHHLWIPSIKQAKKPWQTGIGGLHWGRSELLDISLPRRLGWTTLRFTLCSGVMKSRLRSLYPDSSSHYFISVFIMYIGFQGTGLFNGKSRLPVTSRVNSPLHYGTCIFKNGKWMVKVMSLIWFDI